MGYTPFFPMGHLFPNPSFRQTPIAYDETRVSQWNRGGDHQRQSGSRRSQQGTRPRDIQGHPGTTDGEVWKPSGYLAQRTGESPLFHSEPG